MAFADIVPILFPVLFVAFLVLERIVPAREQTRIRGWWIKGVLTFVVVGAINAIVPAVVLGAAGDHAGIVPLRALGDLGGAVVLILASDLVGYWVHRALHTSGGFVWRWTHQLHHSAERMDMLGASWFHPLDILAQQVGPTVVLGLLLGVTPTAGAIAGLAGFFFGISPHLNVRTPRWLGYVFQRPEMHAVHHTRGVHAYNYGVLAFSDLLFGTWRNPAEFPAGDFGFWDGASEKIGGMLVGRDVSAP